MAGPPDERCLVADYLLGRPDAVTRVDGWIGAAVVARARHAREDRDDIEQEVRTRLIDALRRERFDHRATLRTFIDRIARNVAIDLMRTGARWKGIARGSHGDGTAGATGPDPIVERVHLERLLAAEGAGRRRLLEMVIVEEIPYADVARRLGLPVGTVKSRVARFRSRAGR